MPRQRVAECRGSGLPSAEAAGCRVSRQRVAECRGSRLPSAEAELRPRQAKKNALRQGSCLEDYIFDVPAILV